MNTPFRFPTYIGDQAIGELTAFLRAHQLQRLAVVADENTYPALGERVVYARLH